MSLLIVDMTRCAHSFTIHASLAKLTFLFSLVLALLPTEISFLLITVGSIRQYAFKLRNSSIERTAFLAGIDSCYSRQSFQWICRSFLWETHEIYKTFYLDSKHPTWWVVLLDTIYDRNILSFPLRVLVSRVSEEEQFSNIQYLNWYALAYRY